MHGNVGERRISTDSEAAAHALGRALDAFVQWRVDVPEHLDAAIAADPTCSMAHAFKGLFLAGGRNRRMQPEIEACERAARDGAGSLTDQERGYVDALTAMATGRNTDAVAAYESILDQAPTDLLAHRLVQQELFWMGEARWMADVVERAAPDWSESRADYPAFLSVRAFSLEEAGERARAERCAREAVERDPTDCWGAHAVAHVMEMQGRAAEGVEWLEGLSPNWAGRNQIVHHLWWHLSLFALEAGDHERVLDLLDHHIRDPASPLVQAVPDAYIDIQNVASLLLRLELRGVDVGARWASVREVAAQRIGNHASPFTDAHAAMILAANGDLDEARALVESMQAFAAGDDGALGPRYRNAAIPAARAAIAHRAGRHHEVVRGLMPARRALWQMGGSHAQRDVFHQILADSCMRAGEHSSLGRLRDELTAMGFERLAARSFYRDACALID